jgi:hypothetical protein
MSYYDPYEEEYAEYRTTQVRYNILKRRLSGLQVRKHRSRILQSRLMRPA